MNGMVCVSYPNSFHMNIIIKQKLSNLYFYLKKKKKNNNNKKNTDLSKILFWTIFIVLNNYNSLFYQFWKYV